MDARTRLVIGGMTTVAASVAVVCTVALTNAVALADSPGTNVASARVLVPAPSSSSSELPSRSPEVATRPEVAEPPAPVVVDDDDAAPPSPAPDAPAPPAAPVAPAPPAASVAPPVQSPPAPAGPESPEEALETALEDGGWDAVRSWALAHGWSQERVDAWITWMKKERIARESRDGAHSSERRTGESTTQRSSAAGGTDTSPQRPANAGSTADRTTGSWDSAHGGTKKDRSRESSDRRDR